MNDVWKSGSGDAIFLKQAFSSFSMLVDIAARLPWGSYYTSIGRNKYSRALLEKAQSFSEQSISQQQADGMVDGSLPLEIDWEQEVP